MCQTTGLLCYFRAECKRALWRRGMLCSHFLGKAAFPFPSRHCSELPFPVHPRRGSASLPLTHKRKKVTASTVITTRPKESASAGKAMESSARKSLLSPPKMQAEGPAGCRRGCQGSSPAEAPGARRGGIRSGAHPPLPAASHLRGVLAVLGLQ